MKNTRRLMRDRWLREDDVRALAADPEKRLQPCLIRWHEGRCTAPAQNVEALIAVTEQAGWRVRDVSTQEPMEELRGGKA